MRLADARGEELAPGVRVAGRHCGFGGEDLRAPEPELQAGLLELLQRPVEVRPGFGRLARGDEEAPFGQLDPCAAELHGGVLRPLEQRPGLVQGADGHEGLDRDARSLAEGHQVLRPGGPPAQLRRLLQLTKLERDPHARGGVVHDVLELLPGRGRRQLGGRLLGPAELQQRLGRHQPRAPRELAGAEALVARGRPAGGLEGLGQPADREEGKALRSRPAARHPRRRGDVLQLLQRAVQAAGERVDAVPDLVVERVAGDEPVALREGLLVTAVEDLELVRGAKVPEGDMGEGPDPLEVRRGQLRDLDRPLGRGEAGAVVELERVDP